MGEENFVIIIGNNISTSRRKLKLTQETLAEMIGVNQDTISRVEKGTTPPKVAKLPDYAKALKCSVLDLLRTPDDGLGEHAAIFAEIISGLSPQNQKKLLKIVTEFVEIIKDS